LTTHKLDALFIEEVPEAKEMPEVPWVQMQAAPKQAFFKKSIKLEPKKRGKRTDEEFEEKIVRFEDIIDTHHSHMNKMSRIC